MRRSPALAAGLLAVVTLLGACGSSKTSDTADKKADTKATETTAIPKTKLIIVEDAWVRAAPKVDTTVTTMAAGMGATTTMAGGMGANSGTATTMAGGMSGGMSGGMTMSGSGSAAYFKITNNGSQDDALLSVMVDKAVADMAEVHETTIKDNVMHMAKVDKVVVAKNSSVEFKKGGYHVMLMNIAHDLKAGETVKLTLHFEKAGDVVVEAPVKQE